MAENKTTSKIPIHSYVISFRFTGPAPSASKGTSIVMNLSDYDAPKQWGAKVVNITDNTMTMKVYTPATCPVGKWDFKFDTFIKSGENTKVFRYSHPHPVYMIFNPWNPGTSLRVSNNAQEFPVKIVDTFE